jgi:hypothetical protein
VAHFRPTGKHDELARIRHLRPVRPSVGDSRERGSSERCTVVELHRHVPRRSGGGWPC